MSRTNPFPGMNPYMEETWGDVHVRLITFLLEALGAEMPDDLVARAELYVELIAPPDRSGKARPDVAIIDEGERWKRGLPPVWSPSAASTTSTISEPAVFNPDEEPPRRWIEIRTPRGGVVTVIEVLSPANKVAHREDYRKKRRGYVDAGANFVEIDLLRAGKHIVDIHREFVLQRLPHRSTHYVVCASRGIFPGRREVYACALRERLPTIRIPLRPHDPDLPLDIQALIDRCYTTGRYWKRDYSRPLDPPLPEVEAAWAEELLKAAGLRG